MSITLTKGVNKHSADSENPTLADYVFDTNQQFDVDGGSESSRGVVVWSDSPVNVYGFDPSQSPNGYDEWQMPPGAGWILIGTTSPERRQWTCEAELYTKGIAVPVSGVADVSITPMIKAESSMSISINKTVDALSDVPPFTQHDIKKVLMVNEEGRLEWTSIRPI
tara:strand:+ start:1494 stop:1991 length:498 start_codon:yes stop_codon:yes gene_type:complete